MHIVKGAIMSLPIFAGAPAQAGDLKMVSPALEKYSKDVVQEDLWKRSGLSPRDRSLITVNALVASGQVA